MVVEYDGWLWRQPLGGGAPHPVARLPQGTGQVVLSPRGDRVVVVRSSRFHSWQARVEVRSLVGVCQMLVAEGDVEQAEPLSKQLLELSRERGDLRSEHFAYHFLGDCALIRGDSGEAEDRYKESLRAALPLGDVLETSFEVQGVGMSAAGKGDWARGIRLAAAGLSLWDSLGATISVPFWDALLDRYIVSARERLGAEADAAWAEGLAMSFDDAVALALGSESGGVSTEANGSA